jgi:hypothetical protein
VKNNLQNHFEKTKKQSQAYEWPKTWKDDQTQLRDESVPKMIFTTLFNHFGMDCMDMARVFGRIPDTRMQVKK